MADMKKVYKDFIIINLYSLMNWFKLVYGPFGLGNMHYKLNFFPDQPGKI